MNCNPSSLQLNWGSEDYEAGDLWGAIQLSSTDKRDYSASLARFPKTSTRLTNSVSFILRKNLFGLNTITSLPHTQFSKSRGKLEIELKPSWRRCIIDVTWPDHLKSRPAVQLLSHLHCDRSSYTEFASKSNSGGQLGVMKQTFCGNECRSWSILAFQNSVKMMMITNISISITKNAELGQSNHPCHSSCCL